jgi:hypothetical protein
MTWGRNYALQAELQQAGLHEVADEVRAVLTNEKALDGFIDFDEFLEVTANKLERAGREAARILRAAIRCDCQKLDAGDGGAWMAVYGGFARDVFEAWQRGERDRVWKSTGAPVHHPDCAKRCE